MSMSITNDYYRDNSHEFFESTVDADVHPLYEHFCKYICPGGKILDFGCGSGRDVKAFLDMGYDSVGVDGSSEMCALASSFAGTIIKHMDFADLDSHNEYDGIWACASLLHVESLKLPSIIVKMRDALKVSGVMYMSFKYGDYEGLRDGRYFTDMNEERFSIIIKDIDGVELVEKWYSEDVRRDRNVQWFNAILRKKSC